MTKLYHVTLQCTDRKVPILLQATTDRDITLVSVSPAPSTATSVAPQQVRSPSRYANGQRKKDISGHDLALEILRSAPRPFTYEEVVKAFTSHGFASNSASPVLSKLIREGLIRQINQGKWEATS